MSGSASSLRFRITAGVLVAVGLSLVAFSFVLYATFRRALWAQFDERLAQDARAAANMVEEGANEPWEFEPASLEDFERKFGAAYFEVWMDNGRLLGRSPSLGEGDLPRPTSAGPTVGQTLLPGGARGRALWTSLPPRQDEEQPIVPSGRRVMVAVARGTAEVDATLSTLRLLLWALGAATLSVALCAAGLTVRRGLRPVVRLVARIDAMDATRLNERLPVEDLPRELQLPLVRINHLLARLHGSFLRERQFTSDVGHELRTPVAGLRSVLEVAASRRRSLAEYETALKEATRVALQMGDLIENLLALTRVESNQERIDSEEIALHELIEDVLKPFSARAGERSLDVANLIPAGTIIVSDRGKLSIVLSNLLANAVEYTASGGRIIVQDGTSSGDLFEILDSGPAIPAEEIDRIFDRFYRADAARGAAGEHFGIGLALTQALCHALGLSVRAENLSDGWVRFAVRRATPSPAR